MFRRILFAVGIDVIAIPDYTDSTIKQKSKSIDCGLFKLTDVPKRLYDEEIVGYLRFNWATQVVTILSSLYPQNTSTAFFVILMGSEANGLDHNVP